MAKTSMQAQEYKWEVEEAASTLIALGPVKKRMKEEPKFRKAVTVELKKRLKVKQSEVVAAKQAMSKT